MHAQKGPERALNFYTGLISEGHSLVIYPVSKHWERWPKFLGKIIRQLKKQDHMTHSKNKFQKASLKKCKL